MIFRKASAADVSAVEEIYNDIHTEEEKGGLMTGWIRGVYPIRATAEWALERGELFVLEDEGRVVSAGIINQDQAEAYAQGRWVHELPADRVCVLHTLVVSPAASKKGYGKAFVCFYEDYARKTGCKACRLDTLEWNSVARTLYRKLGYGEVGIVSTELQGLTDVSMVLLEKFLG